MKTLFKFLFVFALLLFLGFSAMADTAVDGLVTDATTLFATVKTLVIDIIGFGLLIFIALKVRRR